MATGPLKLQIVINADGSAAVANIEKVSGATKKLGAEAQQAESSASALSGKLAGLFTGATLTAAVAYSRQIAMISDEINAMTVRMSRMGGESGFAKLTQLADTLGTSMQAAAEQVQGFVPGLTKVGKSFDDAIKFAGDFNKTLRVFGVSGQQAASVALQLSQALGGSVAQWEELKAIQEAAPGVTSALEQILQGMLKLDGVSFKEMAEQGKITPKVLAEAWGQLFASLKGDFASLPDTLVQQESRLGAAWDRLLKVLDDKTHISDTWKMLTGQVAFAIDMAGLEAGGKTAPVNVLTQRARDLSAEIESLLKRQEAAAKNPTLTKIGDAIFGTSNSEDLARQLVRVKEDLAGVNKEINAILSPDTAASTGKLGTVREQIAALQREAEKAKGLPPMILDPIWRIESGRGTDPAQLNYKAARGEKGFSASGLYQFIDANKRRYDYGATYESQTAAAAALFGDILAQSGGDVARAAGGYKSGSTDPGKWDQETRAYVDQFLAYYRDALGQAQAGNTDAAKLAGKLATDTGKATSGMAAKTAETMAGLQGRIAAINAKAKQEADAVNAEVYADPQVRAKALLAIETKRAADVLAVRKDIEAKTLEMTKSGLSEEQSLRVEAAQAIAQIEADKDLTASDRATRINAVNADMEKGLARLNGTAELTNDQLRVLGERYGTAGSASAWYANELRMLKEYQDRVGMSSEEHAEALRRIEIAYGKVAGPMASYVAGLREQVGTMETLAVDMMEGFRRNLIDGLEKGKVDFGDFVDYAKRRLIELSVNTIFVNVIGNVSTASAETAAGLTGPAGTTGATGGASSLSSLSSIGSFFGGNSLGLGSATALTEGARYLGTSFGAGTNTAIMGLSGTSNLVLGGAGLVGGLLGTSLFGDKGYGSIGASVGSAGGSLAGAAIGSVIPGVGNVIGALVGGLLGGGGGGFLGSLFGSDKAKTPIARLDIEQGRFLLESQQGMDAQVASITGTLTGVNTLLDQLTAMLGQSAAQSRAGATRQAAQPLYGEQIQDWLKTSTWNIINDMVKAGSGSMADQIKQIWADDSSNLEAFSQRVAEVKAVYDALPQAIAALSAAGIDLGADAEQTALALAGISGGLDNLLAAKARFDQAFPADGAQAVDAVATAFQALGLALPATSAGYRDLVMAQDLTTEAGRSLYVSLLGLTDAMVDHYAAADRAAQAEREAAQAAEERYLQLFDAGALAARSAEAVRAAWDKLGVAVPESRDAYKALVDAQDLSTESGQALRRAMIDLAEEMDAFFGAAVDGAQTLRDAADQALVDYVAWVNATRARAAESVQALADPAGPSAGRADYLARRADAMAQDAGWDLSLKGMTKQDFYRFATGALYGTPGAPINTQDFLLKFGNSGSASAKYMDLVTAYYDQVDALESSTSALRAWREQLRDWVADLRGTSPAATEGARLDTARAAYSTQLAAAMAGDQDAREGITRQAQAYLDAARSQSATATEYAAILSRVAAQVEALANSKETPGYADGGIATGPTTGYPVTLHGAEAVIPLKHGAVQVQINYASMLAELKALRSEVRSVGVEQIRWGQKTARLLEQFDRDGLPEVRT